MFTKNQFVSQDLQDAIKKIMNGDTLEEAKVVHPNQQRIDVHEPEKDEITADDFKKLRAMKKEKPMKEDAEKDKVVAGVQAAMLKSRGNVIAGQAQRAAARLAAKIKSGTKGKTAKEEIEQVDELSKIEEMLNEVLAKDAKAADYISDFVKSDDPKFAGKSKAKRIQMALGAYYSKQRGE